MARLLRIDQGMNNELLTVAELARELHVSADTIYRWSEQGDLPAIKLGRVLRFRRADISGWLNARAVRSSEIST